MSDIEAASEHPWLSHYEAEVPHTIDVPDIGLHELLERTAVDYPSNTATIFFGERLTYAQLDERANRFAAALQESGVQAGETVAIILPNCPQFMVAFFGVLKAGAVALPLNPALVVRELESQFNEAGVKTVVAISTAAQRVQEIRPSTPVERLIVTWIQDTLSPLLSLMLSVRERPDLATIGVSGEGVALYSDLVRHSSTEYTRADVHPGAPAALLPTAGTTGTPRSAVLSHRNLVANALQMNAWVWDTRPQKHDIYLGVIPFFHSYGMTVVMNLAVVSASTIVMLPRFVMKDVLRAIARWRPTVFPGVPAIYSAIAHHSLSQGYDLRSIRVCISGAAPLPARVQEAFESITGARLVEGYGLTEASPVTHCAPIYGERRTGSIGLPLPLTEARIVDPDTGMPLPVGEVGELHVRGPQVMTGYFAHPDETADVIRDGWLCTGDMARQDEDGYFYIMDRKKDVILVNGFSVYPREVEIALYENEKVLEAVVAGLPNTRLGEMVKAYVVLQPDADATEAELRKFAAERLADYKVPSRIEFRESLPKSVAGKYLRKDLIAEELGQ